MFCKRHFAPVYRQAMHAGRSPLIALGLVACAHASLPVSEPSAASGEPAAMGPPPVPGLAAATPRPAGPGRDGFGVRMLYPSAPGGLTWSARWQAPPRRFSGVDPHDPWFDAEHGDATYRVPGDGTLRIGGPLPRMYVHDPARAREWQHVEITVYFARLDDRAVPWGGMVSVARTNHGTTGNENVDSCDTRGIGARMRYDGAVDFEKETKHPQSEARARRVQWPSGLPFGRWLGYKHVVYDLADGRVRQELWLDESDGVDGGQFRLLNAIEDDGNGYGSTAPACRSGVAPELPLRAGAGRPGSESGKPNVSVYFRSDEVGIDGLVYKWASVREIQPPAP